MMDDSCAVCAEALQWVAYGPCGHREVCATCVARLRVVCKDRRCCLCQSHSDVVFITKALGEYTRSINDFSEFPGDVKEGKVGSFWYHEGIQAFFDDFNQYKAIIAMSKLSCRICDNRDGKGKEGSKRKGRFKSIDHLRSHISTRHELFMCGLCLDGRKVFISEQKLYTKAQLEGHYEKGNLEVDGDESERCGFSGHPLCEFCQLNFYGENEIYFHLSTDHFTCHICKRQHPGSFKYYKDYDDLEKHFRDTHYLCEDYSCLEKKFIVFDTDFEMKKHHNSEHGGNMSRSECNASLQTSTCFRLRERNDGGNSRSRAVGQIANNAELPYGASSSTHRVNGGTSLTTIQAVHSAERVVSSSHSQATVPSPNGLLEDTAFPPLPSASKRRNRKPRNTSLGVGTAPLLHRRHDGSLTVVNSSPSVPAVNSQPSSSSASSSSWFRSSSNSGLASLLDPVASSQSYISPSFGNSTTGISLTTARGNSSTSSAPSLSSGNYIREAGPNSPSVSILSSKSVKTSTSTGTSDAKPNEVLAAASGGSVQKMEELAERIRAELGFDKDKFAAFKLISKEYRQGLISAGEFLLYVHQFGLSHLTVELARLCPDPDKQMELLEVHNSSLRESVGKKNALDGETNSSMAKTGSKKGKEKCIDHQSSSKIDFPERDQSSNIEASHASRKGKEKCTQKKGTPPEILTEVGKGNPIGVKGKEKYVDKEIDPGSRMTKASAVDGKTKHELGKLSSAESKSKHMESIDAGAGDDSKNPLDTKPGVKKGHKKTPKFLRMRLGESSTSVLPDPEELRHIAPDRIKVSAGRSEGLTGLSGGGAWQNGGGRKLVMAMAKPRPSGCRS